MTWLMTWHSLSHDVTTKWLIISKWMQASTNITDQQHSAQTEIMSWLQWTAALFCVQMQFVSPSGLFLVARVQSDSAVFTLSVSGRHVYSENTLSWVSFLLTWHISFLKKKHSVSFFFYLNEIYGVQICPNSIQYAHPTNSGILAPAFILD